MKISKLYTWRCEFCSIIEDNVEFVVAPTLFRALETLKSSKGGRFVDQFLLKIEFHSVLPDVESKLPY